MDDTSTELLPARAALAGCQALLTRGRVSVPTGAFHRKGPGRAGATAGFRPAASRRAADGEVGRRTAIESRDRLAAATTIEQRRADALVLLLRGIEKSKPISGVGGTKVIVTLDYHKLAADAAGAGVIGQG